MKAILPFQRLFNPSQNCETVTYQLCKLLDTPVTKTAIQKQLEEYFDYQGLLSLSDVVKNTRMK